MNISMYLHNICTYMYIFVIFVHTFIDVHSPMQVGVAYSFLLREFPVYISITLPLLFCLQLFLSKP